MPKSHNVWPFRSVSDKGGYDVQPALAAPPSTKKLDPMQMKAGHMNQ